MRIYVLIAWVFTLSLNAKTESVNYDFAEGIPEGIGVENAPASVIDGALKIIVDENSTKWTASVLIDLNEDVFDNPIMKLRYKVGTPHTGTTANFPITLMIDELYTQNGDNGTWRIYPEVNLSNGEWQDLEVDLGPLIASWESTHSTSHGNIQQLMMFIGNNNGPYTGGELFIDYIRIGDFLSAKQVEINPDNKAEILIDLGVPVSGSPEGYNFLITENGSALIIDTVFIRNDNNIVVSLENSINVPQEVADLPTLVLTYNGNDDIKYASGIVLEAFQEEISFTAYAENLWKYWGKYEFEDIPYSSAWSGENTIVDGWDWSVPEFVIADSLAYIWYKDEPNMEFSCQNLNDVYIQWNELEPVQGQYKFDLLRQKIRDAAVGYDGVTLRLLAAIWKWDTYPDPGGTVPQWLADRTSAPRWMDELDIAKIRMGNGDVVAYNMDIMDPDYHDLYKKFISAFRETDIPDMEELKIVNVCYRSGSAGEEFTKYDPGNNSVEAQYSAQVIEQRTKERLDVWAGAFTDNVRKLMYVGSGEDAYTAYAGQLGMGSRQGFVEMYNGFVDEPQFGFTINEETRYVEVDENNLFIATNPAFGDENEEYTSESKFGWKESFPYRYYVSSFRMLQQRRNYIMHAGKTLNPELTWYLGMELSRKVENTPDAWAMLSEYYLSPWANNGKEGLLKNIERWLYQRDEPGYMTTPAMLVPSPKDQWYSDGSRPYDYTARKGKKIGFYVDDRMFPGGEQPMAIKVSFYDGVAGTLILVYENNEGIQEDSVITNGTDQVRTATFFIDARLEDNSLNFDFELHSEEEVPVFFVRVIKTEPAYENTDQSSYGGKSRTIPGLIEGEHYDESTEGFGFHDDNTKEGDPTQRPEDNVDIVSRATASNGYSIGYTNEGEWLEYTVDVTPGNYDIILYYFCGETPGDMVVSLDGEVVATINGLENNGWETQSTITVEKVAISGGKDKILRLEFVDGAGFDIDAIEFIGVIVPVTGISLEGCPSDTLIAGNSQLLKANLEPVDPDDSTLNWSSSNSATAAVDNTGLVTALSEGTATITVITTDGGFTDQCGVRVRKAIIPVLSVRIDNCPGAILDAGDTHPLSALVSPADATDQSVRWSSSDTLVATVDAGGLIRAVSEGTATISVTTADGRYTNSCMIGVKSPDVNSNDDLTYSGNNIKVFPNPVSETLHIEFPQENNQRSIRIFDCYGKLLYHKNARYSSKSVEVEELQLNGFIIVQVISDQDVSVFKVSVTR